MKWRKSSEIAIPPLSYNKLFIEEKKEKLYLRFPGILFIFY